MAGGVWEYVAGYLSEISPLADYNKLASADDKYKDKYVGVSDDRTINYEANKGKYGDAMYETSSVGTGSNSWDSDSSEFVDLTYPSVVRGGRSSQGDTAIGIFAFARNAGVADRVFSFRPVVSVI